MEKWKSAKEISTKYERRESSMRWLDYRIIDGTMEVGKNSKREWFHIYG